MWNNSFTHSVPRGGASGGRPLRPLFRLARAARIAGGLEARGLSNVAGTRLAHSTAYAASETCVERRGSLLHRMHHHFAAGSAHCGAARSHHQH
jgi:hypothetical protein